MGLAATKPIFFDLRRVAGDDAVQVLAHADIAEIGAGVRRVLALRPEAAAMAELHVRILFRHGQHVRVEVAEGGGEERASRRPG